MQPTLKIGAELPEAPVKAFQCLIRISTGRSFLPYNEDLSRYAETWQRAERLTIDGIIGHDSWHRLAENATTCSTSKGAQMDIMALQILLGCTPDGIFGRKTKAAVAAFQSSCGLKANGICGPMTWHALLCGEMPSENKFVQPVDYKQGDSRWGSVVYTSVGNKKQTIANSGCGPTAMANIVATLKDKSCTPKNLAALAMSAGYRTASSGTSWGFFKYVAGQYKFSKFVQTTSLETLKQCLATGGYAVCSMAPGYWTKGGHFITAWKYDETYIYCNDPASSSRKKQKLTEFMRERKAFFCFWA